MSIKQAAALLLCYVIVASAQQSSNSRDALARGRRTCYNILRTPAETRDRMERQQFDEDDPETHCAVRCFGISSGMYDDERGTNLEHVLRPVRGYAGYGEYRRALWRCLRGIRVEQYGEDYCRKSFLHFQCTRKAWRHVARGNYS